jgi:hypothetical protein
MLANRLNEGTMSFTDEELNSIYDSIVFDIEKKTKYNGTKTNGNNKSKSE